MYAVVVFIKEISAPAFTQGTDIFHKKLSSHTVGSNFSARFGNAPIYAGRSTDKQVISLEIGITATEHIPVMNYLGIVFLGNFHRIFVNFKSVIAFNRYACTLQSRHSAGYSVI